MNRDISLTIANCLSLSLATRSAAVVEILFNSVMCVRHCVKTFLHLVAHVFLISITVAKFSRGVPRSSEDSHIHELKRSKMIYRVGQNKPHRELCQERYQPTVGHRFAATFLANRLESCFHHWAGVNRTAHITVSTWSATSRCFLGYDRWGCRAEGGVSGLGRPRLSDGGEVWRAGVPCRTMPIWSIHTKKNNKKNTAPFNHLLLWVYRKKPRKIRKTHAAEV